jgi:DNA-binding protein HU-beta
MNKAELIAKLAQTAKLNKAQSGKAVESFVNIVSGALKKNDSVTLVGFGTFKVAHRKARSGVNPKTGAKIQIKACKVPRFSAGKALKESIR